jgi:hypothetical protein
MLGRRISRGDLVAEVSSKKPIRIAIVEDDLASRKMLVSTLQADSDYVVVVEHGTANENEDRIVVAFNVMIGGLVEAMTMRLELK